MTFSNKPWDGWPGLRMFVCARFVRGRMQMGYRLPKSNVPMYALKRGKGDCVYPMNSTKE
jgi:hypothetical protein